MKVEGRKDRYPEARARQRGRERGEGGRRRRRGGLRRRRSRRRRRRKPVRGGGGGGLAAERGCGPGRAREGALGAPAAAASRPLFCPFPPPCVMLPWPGLPSRSCLRPAPPPRGWMEFFPLDRGQLRGRGEAGPGAGEGPDGGPPGRGPVRGRAVGRRGVRGGERRLHRRGRRGGARWARRGDAGGRAARPCLRLGRQRGEAARRGSAGGDYEERSHLHDNFTQMTLSLQEEAAAGGSFEVAFPAAAEKMKRAILELKKGIQEVARRFRCQGCYSTLCDLPLDCPGEGAGGRPRPGKSGMGAESSVPPGVLSAGYDGESRRPGPVLLRGRLPFAEGRDNVLLELRPSSGLGTRPTSATCRGPAGPWRASGRCSPRTAGPSAA
ncbi:sperm acrosome membrane-associated protein 6 isoform X3 [Cavia porcellus]|uniref:sperm acrosome membrane-associated protein 6 isoform X3 n=1 Tax=Cavia porcellus TaxID=10141 RepID=UPI002FE2E594